MARNQGLVRLVEGVERIIHASEKSRGYIFVSKDQALREDCRSEVILHIDGLRIGSRQIDNYGRIFPRLGYDQKIQNSKYIKLQYEPAKNNLFVTLI